MMPNSVKVMRSELTARYECRSASALPSCAGMVPRCGGAGARPAAGRSGQAAHPLFDLPVNEPSPAPYRSARRRRPAGRGRCRSPCGPPALRRGQHGRFSDRGVRQGAVDVAELAVDPDPVQHALSRRQLPARQYPPAVEAGRGLLPARHLRSRARQAIGDPVAHLLGTGPAPCLRRKGRWADIQQLGRRWAGIIQAVGSRHVRFERFRDHGGRLWRYGGRVLVRCPRCAGCATVTRPMVDGNRPPPRTLPCVQGDSAVVVQQGDAGCEHGARVLVDAVAELVTRDVLTPPPAVLHRPPDGGQQQVVAARAGHARRITLARPGVRTIACFVSSSTSW